MERQILLVRHGKTQGNLQRRYLGGGTDEPLCKEGIAELESFVERGLYNSFTPDLVFASPMKRCLESVNIICNSYEIRPVESLREMSFGDFENLTHAEIIGQPGCENFGIDREHMIFRGGESIAAFTERCMKAFNGIIASEQKKIAIVTHGGVIMAIMSELYGGDMYDYIVENGKGYLLFGERGRESEPRWIRL